MNQANSKSLQFSFLLTWRSTKPLSAINDWASLLSIYWGHGLPSVLMRLGYDEYLYQLSVSVKLSFLKIGRNQGMSYQFRASSLPIIHREFGFERRIFPWSTQASMWRLDSFLLCQCCFILHFLPYDQLGIIQEPISFLKMEATFVSHHSYTWNPRLPFSMLGRLPSASPLPTFLFNFELWSTKCLLKSKEPIPLSNVRLSGPNYVRLSY